MLNTWVELMPLKMWISSRYHICFLDEGKDKFSQNKDREIWIRLEVSAHGKKIEWAALHMKGILCWLVFENRHVPESWSLILYLRGYDVLQIHLSKHTYHSLHVSQTDNHSTLYMPLVFYLQIFTHSVPFAGILSPSIKASSLRYCCSNGP